MNVKIKKAFPYAHDGLKNRRLEIGSVEEIRDELVERLVEAGYVERTTETAKAQDPAGAGGGAPGGGSGGGGETKVVGLFKATHVAGKWWNVVNAAGEKQSEKGVSEEEATKLADDLNAKAQDPAGAGGGAAT